MEATNDTTKILDKVEKLLAMARSTTIDAERDSFEAKAQELISRHAIDMAMLRNGDAPTEDVTHRDVRITNPYPRDGRELLATVARANGCFTLFYRERGDNGGGKHGGNQRIFGTERDIETTVLLYNHLRARMSDGAMRMMADPSRGISARGMRVSYCQGFISAVNQRLRAANNAAANATEGAALVLVDRNKRAEDFAREITSGRWGKGTGRDVRSMRAMQAGYADGSKGFAGHRRRSACAERIRAPNGRRFKAECLSALNRRFAFQVACYSARA